MLTNWNLFLNENKYNWYNIDEKLSILRNYIYILKNSKKDYNLPITYFTVLHNFLIVERMFFDDVKLNKKEINKHLKLENLRNIKDVYKKFLELYNTDSVIRINVETIDTINSIKKYISIRPELYSNLIKKITN
jgi:hypothetical protein